MNTKSKILKLRGSGPFKTKQAEKLRVSSRMLSYYVEKGLIEKIGSGLYAFPEDLSFDLEDIIKEKLKIAPQAVVGLDTALKLYDLTEESPATVDLIVPLSNVPKSKMTDVSLYRVKDELHKKEVKKINGIPVTSIERTLLELMRKKKSFSQVLKILILAKAKGMKINISKMKNLAKEFRVQGLFNKLMEAYL